MIRQEQDKFAKSIFIVSLFVFALTFMIYKYRLIPDSPGYIEMAASREPFYPFFLFIFRFIFKNYYLYAASIAQNLLAAYAVYFAVINIKRLFNLNKFIACLIFMIFLAPFFLTIIFSRTGVVISCSVCTEAVTMPLYYIYFTLIIKYILNHELKNYVEAIILSLILALTRGQLLMLFIINFFAMIFACKKFIKPLLIMLASFILAMLISRCYFYITHGKFIGNTYGPVAAAPAVLLSGSMSDAALFKDDEIREIYIKIMREIDEKGYKEHYRLSNLEIFKSGKSSEAVYDELRLYTGSVIYNYAADKGLSGLEAEIARDKIAANIIKTIIKSPDFIKNFIRVYLSWAAVGFVNSVAFVHPVLNIYAGFIYIIALSLLIICVKNKLNREALFMFFVMLALTGFVTSVSLVVTPISRYVFYGLPFLYAAIVTCFIKIILNLNLNNHDMQ